MSAKRFFKKAKKNTSGNEKKSQSPRIYRIIPELFVFPLSKITPQGFLRFYRRGLKVFIVIVFILTAVIVGVDLYENIKVKQEIDNAREKLTQELKFWKSFIEKNNRYRDAYLKASVLEYKLGNVSAAKMYAEKGLSLDPNSKDGKKLERFLLNR